MVESSPAVGNVRDVAVDGETASVVDERTPERLADAVRRLEADDRWTDVATKAPRVRQGYSYDAAADGWRRILPMVGVEVPKRRPEVLA